MKLRLESMVEDYDMEKGVVVYKTPVEGEIIMLLTVI